MVKVIIRLSGSVPESLVSGPTDTLQDLGSNNYPPWCLSLPIRFSAWWHSLSRLWENPSHKLKTCATKNLLNQPLPHLWVMISLVGGGQVEAMPGNFTPTPALPHQGGGRKNLQPMVRQSWEDTLYQVALIEVIQVLVGATRWVALFWKNI
jgi:hypothetical protein